MPYRIFGIDEVAQYLHLNRAEIERLVKEQDIPFERRGARLAFRKVDIDSWASPRVMGLAGRRLAEYHEKLSRPSGENSPQPPLLSTMVQPDFVNSALPAKTKASVLREMAALANKTGRVLDLPGLVAGLEAREALCSTGLPGGLALLHTRQSETFLFESPFVVLGRALQQVHFGSPDGRPADLFFLVACPDHPLHLRTLARICLMAQNTRLLDELRAAPDSVAMYDSLLQSEAAVLQTRALPG
jgi:PTS system nitrogen regulatory IIA component